VFPAERLRRTFADPRVMVKPPLAAERLYPALHAGAVGAEIERAVWQRAKAEFLDQKIGHTKRATGVLLFLSMTEHRAIVLADHSISAKFNQDSWQEVCNRLVAGLKSGDLKEGLVSAINLSGSMMTKHFPAVDGGGNQLPDRLVIRE
jgi:putative membrane protein